MAKGDTKRLYDREQHEYEVATARTIKEQLVMVGGPAMIMSWGPHSWGMLRAPKAQILGKWMLGGLMFKVQGRLFKGFVRVWLSGDDTYTVELGHYVRTHNPPTFKPEQHEHGVYFDQLAGYIDSKVETPEH